MKEITYGEAIGEALVEAMSKDERIIVYGEDVAKRAGSFFPYYHPLTDRFQNRLLSTPISEETMYGSTVGVALAGMKPVVDFRFGDFLITGVGAVMNQIMKIRYMTGGQANLPIVLRGPIGPGGFMAAQHSSTIESIFMHVPGIEVIVPSVPYDAKGMLMTALLKSVDPVLCFEYRVLYKMKGLVPEDEYYIPFGVADVKREGRDLTIVTIGKAVHDSLKAAESLSKEGIDTEVIDLRTLVPWDKETVMDSVKKTRHVVIVQDAWKRCGWGAEIAATVQEEAFGYLDAPMVRVGARNVQVPFSPPLEDFVKIKCEDVEKAVRKVLGK